MKKKDCRVPEGETPVTWETLGAVLIVGLMIFTIVSGVMFWWGVLFNDDFAAANSLCRSSWKGTETNAIGWSDTKREITFNCH